MQKILLIEDQLDYQLTVRALLEDRCHLILAPTATDGLSAARSERIDLILLDVNLPDGNGFELVGQLKAIPGVKDIPIVMLTGRSEISDRVAGFALGIDDYVVKPFEPLEFRARIEAKLQARLDRESSGDFVRSGRLLLDRTAYKAFIIEPNGSRKDLSLTPHEFRLLQTFATREGAVLSRDYLIGVIWGRDVHVLERTVDRHVSSLRKKLSDDEKIEAVPGEGYRFSVLKGAHGQ